ncbi:MAG: hypothetical protein ACD_63C00146G0006 [uncultured bacterium]|nr:MAG: hypothetical protein ACD_63C00146G0006 [uncultured bacterium]
MDRQKDLQKIDQEMDRALFMLRHGRKIKVLVVILIVIAVVGIGAYIGYEVFVPKKECTLDEHCQKGYRCDNGKCAEEPVEKPPADLKMQVEGVYVFPSVPGKYDVLAMMKNPDRFWGIVDMEYVFIAKDSSGREVGRYAGASYILPSEEKYIAAIAVPFDGIVTSADVEIIPQKWVKAPEYKEPNIEVKDISYKKETNFGKSKLLGKLINSSIYSFEEVEVYAVLLRESGEPAGVNRTTLNALFAGEERDFTLIWFSDIPYVVARENVKVEADIYNTENFVKASKAAPEKFQFYEEPEEGE